MFEQYASRDEAALRKLGYVRFQKRLRLLFPLFDEAENLVLWPRKRFKLKS
jgi:hypothetical protein